MMTEPAPTAQLKFHGHARKRIKPTDTFLFRLQRLLPLLDTDFIYQTLTAATWRLRQQQGKASRQACMGLLDRLPAESVVEMEKVLRKHVHAPLPWA